MGIIDDLIAKGKIKSASISEEMVRKELEVGKKDFGSAFTSFEYGNYKWATIQAYYAKIDSPKAALSMLDKIDETILRLKDFPELGVVPKDNRLKKLGYKVLIIGNYIVFYVVRNKTIEIRRILHGKRNYKYLL